MTITYVHHQISAAPRQWQAVANRLIARRAELETSGGVLYGIWRSQIGRPRDELTVLTVWSRPTTAGEADAVLLNGTPDVQATNSLVMTPTLRPLDTTPPIRQGNYAFRWFVTPEDAWQQFLDLCAQAWPGFEAAYDSQVIGLWRCTEPATEATAGGAANAIRSLLLTRRPNVAMWERSKLPEGAAETAVRETLSRRYDLCTWTVVYTTTLLTASDIPDQARWA
jgi:hypothetical protein